MSHQARGTTDDGLSGAASARRLCKLNKVSYFPSIPPASSTRPARSRAMHNQQDSNRIATCDAYRHMLSMVRMAILLNHDMLRGCDVGLVSGGQIQSSRQPTLHA